MPDTVEFQCVTGVHLAQAGHLKSLVQLFESHPTFRPTHWGVIDGGAKQPYDPDGFVAEMRKLTPDSFDNPQIQRRKPPKYEGRLGYNLTRLANVSLRFVAVEGTDVLKGIFTFGTALANHLKVEFGVVHPTWDVGKKGEAYNISSYMNVGHVQAYGPMAVCARTWMGPHVASLFGKEVLAAAGLVVRDTSWGGLEVDLIAEPWLGDAKTLRLRQQKTMKALLPAGVFGDYSDTPFNIKKGARWEPIPVAV